jgi:drug/metabolite transporter (DMT)-like permease
MSGLPLRLVLAMCGVVFLVFTWIEYRREQGREGIDPRLQRHRKKAVVGYGLGLFFLGGSVVSIQLGHWLADTIGVILFIIALVCFGYGIVGLFMIGWIKGGPSHR